MFPLIAFAGGPTVRQSELQRAQKDLSSLDAELDALSAMAADLGKQLDAPKEVSEFCI